MENKGPMTREEKVKLSKEIDKIFDKLDKTFDDTFKRADVTFQSAEARMRESEKRLREKMENNTADILRRRSGVMETLKNYDFTVDTEELMRKSDKNRTVVFVTLMCSAAALLMVIFSIIAVNWQNSTQTTPQPLNPPAIEETYQNKKL